MKKDLSNISEFRTMNEHPPHDLAHDGISVALDVQNSMKIFSEEAQSPNLVVALPATSESEQQSSFRSENSKDVSRFEIGRLHNHPRFLNFKTMDVPIIQCFFWPNAWQVLVTCTFLNCTRRGQVEKVVWKFFELYPTPEALLAAPDEEVQEVIRTLGFYKRRTTALKRLSEDFIAGNWKSPEDLRSVGVYAATCYRMMFEFELGSSPPEDHALKDLWVWMRRELRPYWGRVLPDTFR